MQLQLFNPGEIINLPVEIVDQQPVAKGVKVHFPARIHMTPIDCNRFDFGKPGGGGYGFAVDVENHLKIYLSKNTKFPGTSCASPFIHYA